MYYAIAWLVLVLAFAVMEGLTAALMSIWFCLGSLVALVAAMLGATLVVQIAIFAIVSVLCMALLRPFASKVLKPKGEKTNADRILGEQALVTEEISNLAAKGQIRVGGEYWTARAEGEETIPEGTQVKILRIEGVKAIVALH